MTALPVIPFSRTAGADMAAALQAVTASDSFPANTQAMLRVKNGNAAACTVTVNPSAGSGPVGTTVAPFALAPAVAATTGDRMFGPFPANPFADVNGLINISYSVTPTVTAAVYVLSAS